MATVKVIFVHGDNFISNVIQTATHGQWAHVGIEMLGGLLEALYEEGVVISAVDKYAGFTTDYIEIDIPDMNSAEQEAQKLLGVAYGLKNCAIGGLHDITGINAPGDGEKTVDCSETVVRILRAGGLAVLTDIIADNITPNDLYTVLKGIGN